MKYRILVNKYGYYNVQKKYFGFLWLNLNQWRSTSYEYAMIVLQEEMEKDKKRDKSWSIVKKV